MGYDLPTAADIKARFPVFAAVGDAMIDAVIAEAKTYADTTWVEADYKPAVQYVAAHMLVKEGVLNPAGAVASGVSVGQVQSESLGDASITYADGGAAMGFTGLAADFASTPYGVAYLRLLRRNRAGPRIV